MAVYTSPPVHPNRASIDGVSLAMSGGLVVAGAFLAKLAWSPEVNPFVRVVAGIGSVGSTLFAGAFFEEAV